MANPEKVVVEFQTWQVERLITSLAHATKNMNASDWQIRQVLEKALSDARKK